MSTEPKMIELREDFSPLTNSATGENSNSDPIIVNRKTGKKKIIIIVSITIIVLAIILIPLLIYFLDKDDEKGNNNKNGNNGGNTNEEQEKIPIIMDVDEGGDDMIAYTLANNSKKFNILGITTVSPGHYIDNVTDVWLSFLEYMDFDNKVYKGENQPIKRVTQPDKFFHDYQINFTAPNKTCENISAVDFMIDTIKNHKKKVTLFLLAPLTNFAQAYLKDNSIINNIEDIIIMGGTKGNGNMQYNPKAEYNIYCDADAANIVFNCGIKIKVLGTDVTHLTEFDDERYAKYLEYNTRSSLLSYKVMKGTFVTWNDNYVHDPVTVLYYLNNNIIELKKYNCNVNTTNPDVMGTDYGSMNFVEPVDGQYNIEYSESINLTLYWETFDMLVQKY